MGGALLTLFRFDEAAECYERARELGMEAQKLAFYFGFREYLTGNYHAAAERFRDVLPTDGENTVSAVYWHTLSSVRAGTAPDLLGEVKPDMRVGHHTYRTMTHGDACKLMRHHHAALNVYVTVYETWHDV